MTGFICHDDYYDRLKRLSNEEVGNLFRQLMLYHAGRYDEMSDFIDNEGIAFDFIASDIDRMEEKQLATSETNRINGSKGGRPRKQKEPDDSDCNQMKADETEKNPTKPNETEEKRTKAYKDKEKDKGILFDRFWNAYPRHEGKANARKAFEKLKADDDLLSTMLKAIEKQKQSPQWQENEGQFIPYPATWLNGKRWEDEVKTGTIRNLRTVPAQDYEQREYTQTQDEARNRMIEMMKEAGAL